MTSEAALPGLAVTRLALSEFRCYRRLTLELEPAPVVLSGPNGAGKTNLLEAISFLAPGRGLRRARLAEVGRRGGNGAWAVAARIASGHGVAEIGTGLATGEGGAERRSVKLDGAFARGPAALADVVSLVWLTPRMDRLFTEGASERRRFLDRLVYGMDPEHARRVAAYERAMRERNRLLGAGGADPGWIEALERAMAEHGVAVAATRRAAVSRLRRRLAADAGPFPGAEVAVVGLLEGWLDAMPALEAEERFEARLAANRRRDAEAGSTAEGPHRSDLEVRHLASGMPAAQCSTGEQKALLIAIVLADAGLNAARFGHGPLLLLDEVAAHLDGERRAALFEAVCEMGVQAWLAGTDRALFAPLAGRAQFLTVRAGAVAFEA